MGDATAKAGTHVEGTRRGEEVLEKEGKEAGRYETGATGAGRPSGGSTARDDTGVDPQEPTAGGHPKG